MPGTELTNRAALALLLLTGSAGCGGGSDGTSDTGGSQGDQGDQGDRGQMLAGSANLAGEGGDGGGGQTVFGMGSEATSSGRSDPANRDGGDDLAQGSGTQPDSPGVGGPE